MKTLIQNIDTETTATVIGLIFGCIITLCGIMVIVQSNVQEIIAASIIMAVISMLSTYGIIVAFTTLISNIKKIIKK